MRITVEDYERNYEVLNRLWNDPLIRIQSDTLRELFPGSMTENEIVIREDDLREAGYVGRLPSFLIKFGRFGFYCYPSTYREYWIRQKSIDKAGLNMYSIFKD